ncbi:MAG: aminotransferase class III-fold pyridoxal phosphate-dependent enzyme, partial [Pseudomonadota bacterium]
ISFRQLFEETPSLDTLAEYLDSILPEGMFDEPAPQPVAAPVETPSVTLPPTTNLSLEGNDLGAILAAALSGTIDQIVDQKLQHLLGNNPNGLAKPTTPKPRPKPVAQKQKEKEIKRKVKGVTSKMKNYENISASNELSPIQRKNLDAFIEMYIQKTKSSKALTAEHRKYYADPRAVTGFSPLWKEIVYQVAAEKSKGSKIWDIDGNEYIDYVMSYGVALFGHMPDFVADALRQQADGGNSLDILPPKAKEIAEMLCELSGMERITLGNTGTDAVLGAVRAARTYTNKERIAVFNTDYHGMIDQFLVRGVNFKDGTRSLPSSVGVPKFHVENVLVLDYDDPNMLDILQEA